MPSGDLKNEAIEPADAGATLRAFRERLFANFVRRADALFELIDSVLATGAVPSTVHLSLAPTTEGAGAASTRRSAKVGSTPKIPRSRMYHGLYTLAQDSSAAEVRPHLYLASAAYHARRTSGGSRGRLYAPT